MPQPPSEDVQDASSGSRLLGKQTLGPLGAVVLVFSTFVQQAVDFNNRVRDMEARIVQLEEKLHVRAWIREFRAANPKLKVPEILNGDEAPQ